jgi:hypothetical protein
MDWTDPQLVIEAGREMSVHSEFSISIHLDLAEAMGMLASLQLSLRHPVNHGPTADRLRTIAGKLERELSYLGPATAELCRRGWDSDHDACPED